MKKIFLISALLFATLLPARASITEVFQSATTLDLNFTLTDTALNAGGISESFTHFTSFPGLGLTFSFDDRLAVVLGDIESFSTNPSSGTFFNVQDFGPYNFSGSYVSGGSTVNWAITSTVTTNIFSGDTWSGRFLATATSRVPDAGSSLALLAIALGGLTMLRRRR